MLGILKPDHLGDLILAAPAIAALRRRFPNSVLLCHPQATPLAEHLFPGLKTRPVLLWHLDKSRSSPPTPMVALRRALANGIERLVCLRWEEEIEMLLEETDCAWEAWTFASSVDRHAAVEHRMAVGRHTGEYDLLGSYSYPHRPPPEGRSRELGRVGLCIACGFRLNAWPLSHWITLAGLLHRDGIALVLIGGPDERVRLRVLVRALEQELGYRPPVILGNADFGSTLRRIAESVDIVVAGDSGTAHLASLVRPVLSLFGGSPWRRFAPLGPDNAIITRNYPCSPCPQFQRQLSNGCHTQECLSNLAPDQVYTCIRAYAAGLDLSSSQRIAGVWMAQAPWATRS